MARKWEWSIAGITLFLCGWLLWGRHARSPRLLEDTDTIGILRGISERDNPWSWFWTDWPLQNHFYRPVSTLFFELDYRLWNGWAEGFGGTNTAILLLTLPSVYLLLRWVSGSAIASALGLALWTRWLGWGPWDPLPTLLLGSSLALAVASYRRNRDAPQALLVLVVGVYLSYLVNGIEFLPSRMVYWLPGRTASVMGLFAVPALLCGWKAVQACKWTWGLGAIVFLALALGSYEQAVMLVPIFLVLRWGFFSETPWRSSLLVGIGMTALYVAVRTAFVSSAVSRYQDQQFRQGWGIALTLSDYLLPIVRPVLSTWNTLSTGIESLLIRDPYIGLFEIVLFFSAVYAVVRWNKWRPILALWLCGFLAILPMAFLKQFEHYHYLPSIFRVALIAYLGWVWFEEATGLKNLRSNSCSELEPKTGESPQTAPTPTSS